MALPQNPLDISVIIPLYNECQSLDELHQQLAAVMEQQELAAEFIFVDDGSTDGSYEILEALHRKDSRVAVLQFRRNYGKSAALAEGFSRAQGRYVVTMDADLQDDPGEIPALIAKLEQGFDLISGWKEERFDPFVKRVSSKLFNFVTGLMTGVRLHDMNCGLKIYRLEVVQTIQVYGQRHRFLPVLAAQHGFRVGEKVVRHHPRKYGETKFGPSRFLSGLFDLITLVFLSRYVRRPLHLFGGLGLLSFTIGFIISFILAFQRIFMEVYLTNRPLLFLGITLVIVGIQFASIGLLGEMLTESRAQDARYSVKNAIGFVKSKSKCAKQA
ncbi:MAG: glycosyltransferase family 2 protein [bacterium]